MKRPPNHISIAPIRPKGRRFEEFFVGQTFNHHWGRTILASDTVAFSTLMMSFVPLYFNRQYAQTKGHPDIVVNPHLVFNMTLGLTVEDCSEAGGLFLGVRNLVYHEPVYPGATITARSETVEVRPSKSRPGFGIVSWRSEGWVDDRLVVSFVRTNLLPRQV